LIGYDENVTTIECWDTVRCLQ